MSRKVSLSAQKPTGAKGNYLKPGMWGGQHISLEVLGTGGAHVEYDCGHGEINQQIVVDRNGGFVARGTHVEEHGGPIRAGEDSNGEPARYIGRVEGNLLYLRVTLPKSKQQLGPFKLTFGSEPRLVKCL